MNKEYLLAITKQLPKTKALCDNTFEQLQLLFRIITEELDNYIVHENRGSGILEVYHSTPENIATLLTDKYSKYLILSKLNGVEQIHINNESDTALRSFLMNVNNY